MYCLVLSWLVCPLLCCLVLCCVLSWLVCPLLRCLVLCCVLSCLLLAGLSFVKFSYVVLCLVLFCLGWFVLCCVALCCVVSCLLLSCLVLFCCFCTCGCWRCFCALVQTSKNGRGYLSTLSQSLSGTLVKQESGPTQNKSFQIKLFTVNHVTIFLESPMPMYQLVLALLVFEV